MTYRYCALRTFFCTLALAVVIFPNLMNPAQAVVNCRVVPVDRLIIGDDLTGECANSMSAGRGFSITWLFDGGARNYYYFTFCRRHGACYGLAAGRSTLRVTSGPCTLQRRDTSRYLFVPQDQSCTFQFRYRDPDGNPILVTGATGAEKGPSNVVVQGGAFGDASKTAPNLAVYTSKRFELPSGYKVAEWTNTLFATVEVGRQSARHAFSVENHGTQALEISGIRLGGRDATDFALVGRPPSALAKDGGSWRLEIVFRPQTPGTKNANILIASNDPDAGNYTIRLQGKAVADIDPIMVVTGNDVVIANGDRTPSLQDGTDLGVHEIRGTGSFLTQKFFVKNEGHSPLKLARNQNDRVMISGRDANRFSTYGRIQITEVQPGSSLPITIVYRPDRASIIHRAAITIRSNDSNNRTFVFNIQATAKADKFFGISYKGEPIEPGNTVDVGKRLA